MIYITTWPSIWLNRHYKMWMGISPKVLLDGMRYIGMCNVSYFFLFIIVFIFYTIKKERETSYNDPDLKAVCLDK